MKGPVAFYFYLAGFLLGSKILNTSYPLFCSLSGRSIYLPDHHVPAGQKHAVALRDDQGAAAGEGERCIYDSTAEGDAGNSCQAARAAEAAAGPGAKATGTDPGDR